MSFLTNPMKIITNLLVKLGFKTSSPVISFALPLLQALFNKYAQAELKIIWDGVKLAEASGKPGFEKFDIAFDYIKAHFIADQKPVVESDINALIEMAVQWLKQKIAPVFA